MLRRVAATIITIILNATNFLSLSGNIDTTINLTSIWACLMVRGVSFNKSMVLLTAEILHKLEQQEIDTFSVNRVLEVPVSVGTN
jgi:hypothetical protein